MEMWRCDRNGRRAAQSARAPNARRARRRPCPTWSRRSSIEELAIEIVRAPAAVLERVEGRHDEYALLHICLHAHVREAEVIEGVERAGLVAVEFECIDGRDDGAPIARAAAGMHAQASVAVVFANDPRDSAGRVRVPPVAHQDGDVEGGRFGDAHSSLRKNSRVKRFAQGSGSRKATYVATTRSPRLRFACSSTSASGSSQLAPNAPASASPLLKSPA